MEVKEIKVSGTELKLAPVGDIQYGAAGCDVDKLERHIEYGVEHGWKFLGMGDYIDTFSPSNRKALMTASSSLYESARELIDDAITSRVTELATGPLGKSKGHWLGFIQGDHEWELQDGQHCDELLSRKLKGEWLGAATILSVKVGRCPRPLRIFATHGRGASVSSTGKTLHLERMLQTFEADIYLMGHSHLLYGYPLDRLKSVDMPDGSQKLVHDTKVLGITGSWLNGYQQGTKAATEFGYATGGYVERAAMRPIPTGGLLIVC